MLYFKMKIFPPYLTFYFEVLAIKEFINCDGMKLLALLKWLLNCIVDTCYLT